MLDKILPQKTLSLAVVKSHLFFPVEAFPVTVWDAEASGVHLVGDLQHVKYAIHFDSAWTLHTQPKTPKNSFIYISIYRFKNKDI